LLVNPCKGGKHAKCKILRSMFPLFVILMLVSLWMIIPMVSNAARNEMLRDIRKLREEKGEILDEIQQLRADRDEQRREWERVHDEELRDIGKLREEKREVSDEVQQFRADRDA